MTRIGIENSLVNDIGEFSLIIALGRIIMDQQDANEPSTKARIADGEISIPLTRLIAQTCKKVFKSRHSSLRRLC
jgi:hypothetical protein